MGQTVDIKRYLTINGRASRTEFWTLWLICMVLVVIIAMADRALGTVYEVGGGRLGLFSTVYTLLALWPVNAAFVRRLHDVGKSGWWYVRWVGLTALVICSGVYRALPAVAVATGAGHNSGENMVPVLLVTMSMGLYCLAAAIWLLALLWKPGIQGANKYGPEAAQ